VSALIAPIQGLDELQRNGYYRTLVFGNLIVTLKEAFAVLPGVARIRTVVVRRTESALECLLAATFDRSRFVAANFGTDGAEQIIYQTHGSFCMEEIGRVGELLPSILMISPRSPHSWSRSRTSKKSRSGPSGQCSPSDQTSSRGTKQGKLRPKPEPA